MSPRISWSLAKVCKVQGAEAVEALLAHSTLAAHAGGKLISMKEAQALFRQLGCSLATARRRMAALRRPLIIEGQAVMLVAMTDERRPRIQVRSAWKLEKDLGLQHLECFEVTNAELANLGVFKLALYDGVAYGRGRDASDGKTIARNAIEALTGASRWTQRRNEDKLGIICQENFAQVWPSAADLREGRSSTQSLKERYGLRIRNSEYGGLVVQISNTYHSNRPGISTLSDEPQFGGVLAKNAQRLTPERGNWSRRQTYPDQRPSADEVRATHDAGGNVDIKVAILVLGETGKRTGLYVRLEAESMFNYGELVTDILSLIAQDRIGWACDQEHEI